ncbi:MAG: DEAD/DEAH box helicase, partial [Rikenellaceae bacterium]
SNRYMREPQVIKVESRQLTTELTEQIYFEVREADKFDALTRIIDIQQNFYGIVFCRTKVSVDDIVSRLSQRGYGAEGLHGDVSQASREKILRRFRDKSINILVATDVAARGIDVNNLSHVINYAIPQDSESYVHRIGRTGRAGNQGTAITFITKGEMRQFGFIKRDIKADIKLEELPSPQDIVETKRKRIIDDLAEIISSQSYLDYEDMAKELLEAHTAEVALSSLIRLAFQEELDHSRYPEIRSFSVDRKGAARIFLAVGRRDGFTSRKIVDMLKEKCGLRDKHIDDISVLDNYSFVSIPFADAESVVKQLGAHRGRPMAEITKESQGGGSSSRRPKRGERSERSTSRVPRKSELRDGASRRDGGYGRRRDDEPRAERRAISRDNEPSKPVLSKEEFDWSVFEDGGSSWDSRPSKSRSSSAKPARGGAGRSSSRGGAKPSSRRGAPSGGGRRGAGRR